MSSESTPEKTNPVSPLATGAVAGAIPALKEVVDPLTRVIPSPPVVVSCREDLNPVMERHQLWIDSVLSPRSDILVGRANLAHADLSGYDLMGVNLSGATLTGTKLLGTLFRGAILKGTDFTGCNAQGADFSGARLQRAKFERADLRDCEFTGAELSGADFRFAKRGSVKDAPIREESTASDTVETSAVVIEIETAAHDPVQPWDHIEE